MMRKIGMAAILSLTAFTAPPMASADDAGPLAISNFNADLYFTNQYMFRGISNTEGPAIQGDVNWTYNGWYLTAWGSNTKFNEDEVEIDAYGGYRWSWSGFNFDVGGLYYTFPGDSCHTTKLVGGTGADAGNPAGVDAFGKSVCPDADYGEFQGIVNYAFSDTFLSPSVTLKYDFSPDFYGSDGDAHAVEGDLALTVPTGPLGLGDLGFEAAVGYQTVDGDQSSGKRLCAPITAGTSDGSTSAACDTALGNPAGTKYQDGYDYTWWRVGVNKNIDGFLFDISYYATDETTSLKNFYFDNPAVKLNPRSLIEPHVVATVSHNFTFP
ncbi:MAG TPA: TorF family putative porin [Gammaproteobacteria bacterium]|nr:TorF family putative porin [Gammaproteobacteria bacterium]